jgi:voltage-gated potassium channel
MAVRALRRQNSDLPIVVTVRSEEGVDEVLREGANHVIQPEFEASIEILRYIMLALGTPLEESMRHIEGIRLHRFHEFSQHPGRPALEQFNDHFIICGFGRLGRAVSRQLRAAGVPHVAVEGDPERARRYGSQEIPVLWGNAIKDRVLIQAGLRRAKGLVAATDNDSVNMHIILAARRLNPWIELIAYGGHEEAAENLRRAGANKIYSPYDLGGMRIAASIVSPVAADLMEKIIAPAAQGSEVAEIGIEEGSAFAGLTLRASQIRELTGAMIFGILRHDGKLLVNPPAEALLEAGSSLITIGTKEQLDEVRKRAAAARQIREELS